MSPERDVTLLRFVQKVWKVQFVQKVVRLSKKRHERFEPLELNKPFEQLKTKKLPRLRDSFLFI